MPTANIYTASDTLKQAIANVLPELRTFLAKKLSCDDRSLLPNEVSLRAISVASSEMIAPIEIDITAHGYKERAKQADEICLSVREFIRQKLPTTEDVRVWLILAELGHSWEE